jgi:hypothetical protein
MKIEVKTEENLFKTYLSKIITSAFESGLVEREKRFRPEIISNDLLDIINHNKSKTREETIKEVELEIENWEIVDGKSFTSDKIKDILNKLKK